MGMCDMGLDLILFLIGTGALVSAFVAFGDPSGPVDQETDDREIKPDETDDPDDGEDTNGPDDDAPPPGLVIRDDFESVILTGSAGNDYIVGNNLNNQIFGLEGDDSIEGGFGANFIDAGPGNDNVLVTNANNIVVSGEGDDTIVATASLADIDGGPGNDTLRVFSSSFARGGEGNDVISSSGGDNFLQGGPGDDTLRGSSGDEMWGGDGDDVLYSVGSEMSPDARGSNSMLGGAGSDLLVSNGGDEMTGGTGADQFRFVDWFNDNRGPFIESVITDFNPEEDVIEIVLVDNAPPPTLETETSFIDGNVTLLANGAAIVTLQGQTTFDTSRVVFVAPEDALVRA